MNERSAFFCKLRCLLLLACPPLALAAQGLQGIAIETALHYGQILRHTAAITIQNDHPVIGQEIGLRFQTSGKKDWHQWQRYPVFGLSFGHFRLGTGAHGDAFAFFPNIDIPIVRRKWWTASFRLSVGPSYITQPYDYFTNPGQNAIGSHWNGTTHFRLGGDVFLNAHLRAAAGVSFTHFSNAGSAQPNYGINIPAGYCSLSYSPMKAPDLRHSDASKHCKKRLGGYLQAGLAYVEYIIFDGPRYPVWSYSGALTLQLNQVNRLALGLDYEFNRAVYVWGLYSTAFADEATARTGASRLACLVADEFLFGDFGVQLQASIYVGQHRNSFVLQPYYEKLNVRYYLPSLLGTRLRPNIGINLKAHKVVAEFISVNVGAGF